MCNYKFKIITKILADRLVIIMHNLVSKEHKGFIRGRNVGDGICLASEGSNSLDKKCFGGNMAIKVDFNKAFETLNWDFFLQVLKNFGFCAKFLSMD